MSTITSEDQGKIKAYLDTHVLPKGLGTKESACSIAAINLALTGKLTDEIPECMSRVIGRWIIRVQDAMPSYMRNSIEWKSLLPMAAGTGRDEATEKRRIKIILDWMWNDVLPYLQPIADKKGFGKKWKRMTDEKTASAASAAAAAAYASASSAAAAAAYAYAADAAAAAAYAAADADAADADAAAAAAWVHFNPCGVLEKLIEA